MAPAKKMRSFRLSHAQLRKIDKLARKLDLPKASVVRLAINRLAELEGVK
jgi:predicted DNA-binding protein